MSKMIAITEDGMCMSSEPIMAHDFLNITYMAMLNLFRNLEQQGANREELYDMANQAASAFLEVYAPDIELRPDLTAEAILNAENEIMEAKIAELEADPDILKKIEEAGE